MLLKSFIGIIYAELFKAILLQMKVIIMSIKVNLNAQKQT